MYIKKFFFYLCLFSLIVSQGRVDGIVAIVGNNIVLHSDVFQQSQLIALNQRVDPVQMPNLFEEIYFTTLDNIINQYTVLDVAEKDTNLVLSDDDVDRALNHQIDDFVSRAGSEERLEEMIGMSMRQIKADYWKDIRDMMIVERYQFSKIQYIDVSRIEVDNFFLAFKDSIPSLPEQYKFSAIEVPLIAGKKSKGFVVTFLDSLREMIVAGTVSFDSLAKIHSQDPGSGSSGGYLGFTERGSLVREYEEVAYSMEPGDISSPIKSQFGYHLIRLIEKRGEKISSQHILRFIDFSHEDKMETINFIENLSFLSLNDPFVFDSIAVDCSKKYNNYSGHFINLSPNSIPYEIFQELQMLNNYETSAIFETKKGYAILFLYDHMGELFPMPGNSWNLIYQYAKQEKQNRIFQSLVDKIKNDTYIKTFLD